MLLGFIFSLLSDAIISDPGFSGFDTYALRPQHNAGSRVAQRHETVDGIGSHQCNKSGNSHGGAAATIMNTLTSAALLTIARPGFLNGNHVSRTTTMSYLWPVPLGSKVKQTVKSRPQSGTLPTLSGRSLWMRSFVLLVFMTKPCDEMICTGGEDIG